MHPGPEQALEELERKAEQAERRLQKLEDDFMAQKRRYESQLKESQDELQKLQRKIETTRQAVRIHRSLQGLPEEDLRSRYRGKTVKEVLVDLARAQGGRLVAREACEVLVQASFTATREQAGNSVHAILCKFQGQIFERVSRGVYRLREP